MSDKYDDKWDKYEKWDNYLRLLSALYHLGLLSNEEYLQMHDGCWDRLDEL